MEVVFDCDTMNYCFDSIVLDVRVVTSIAIRISHIHAEAHKSPFHTSRSTLISVTMAAASTSKQFPWEFAIPAAVAAAGAVVIWFRATAATKSAPASSSAPVAALAKGGHAGHMRRECFVANYVTQTVPHAATRACDG